MASTGADLPPPEQNGTSASSTATPSKTGTANGESNSNNDADGKDLQKSYSTATTAADTCAPDLDLANDNPANDPADAPSDTPSNSSSDPDTLITSTSPSHPANQIPALCRAFYTLGWVTGTGGGTSIRQGPHIFLAPSGVQKEKIEPRDIFVLDYGTRRGVYLRRPAVLKPSQCTPLFLAAFDRGAGCCIHTHSQWAVLVTLLVERDCKKREEGGKSGGSGGGGGGDEVFEIEEIEQIKGIPRGRTKTGMLGYFDRLRIPIIENTAQ